MLQKIKDQWKALVESEVKALALEQGADISVDIQVLTPPKPEMGDVAFPMFSFAKAFKSAPPVIANEINNPLNIFI